MVSIGRWSEASPCPLHLSNFSFADIGTKESLGRIRKRLMYLEFRHLNACVEQGQEWRMY